LFKIIDFTKKLPQSWKHWLTIQDGIFFISNNCLEIDLEATWHVTNFHLDIAGLISQITIKVQILRIFVCQSWLILAPKCKILDIWLYFDILTEEKNRTALQIGEGYLEIVLVSDGINCGSRPKISSLEKLVRYPPDGWTPPNCQQVNPPLKFATLQNVAADAIAVQTVFIIALEITFAFI